MASYQTITVDTVGPAGVNAVIDGGAAITTDRDVSLAVTTTDPDTDGYTVLIWGDVDESANANIQQDQGDSTPIALASPHTVRVSTGDGVKTIHVIMLDHLDNPSAEDTDSIELSTDIPVATLGTPDRDEVSEQPGFNESNMQLSFDVAVDEWKVKVVPATTSLENQGTQIGTANGSANVTGGVLAAATPVTVTINTTDLLAASAGNGDKVVKAFGRNAENGLWSAA